ncbi:MAG: FecR domain-containing protein [Opitutaceae bacterium]|nr:FecR domain-containing protein [Opitutaceae bacterium]
MNPRGSSAGNCGSTRPSEAEAIAATAAAWLAERDDGLTPARTAEFARWRAADPRHEAATVRLEKAWVALAALRDYRPEAVRHPDPDLLGARRARPARVISFPVIAAATAVAACLAVAAVGWFGPLRAERADGPTEQRYATTVEGYERVTLEDGSVVELNSATELGVRFSPAERRVRLVRGEAHFTVAKNKARPFVVEAGGVAVRAVGTAFNVRLGVREIEVLVTEGQVALTENAGPALVAAPSSASTQSGTPASGGPTLLGANHRAVVAAASPAAPVVERVTPAAVRTALAWQGARLVFADTPLAEVVAQFNRRNTVQLELADAELRALPIGGSFRAENVEGFVRLLVSGGDVAVERAGATRIVLHRAK